MTNQVQIPNRIQYFMFDKLILIAQAIRIEYPILIHHDSVIQTAPTGQTGSAHGLHISGKAKGTCPRYGFDVGILTKIHLGKVGRGVDRRVLKINGKLQHKTFVGLQTGPLAILAAALLYLYGLEHTQKLFGCLLLLQPSTTQQIHKGAGTAIHDGYLLSSQIDMDIINPQTRKGGHEVLYRGDDHRALLQYRGHDGPPY